jgi:hypothetical protein
MSHPGALQAIDQARAGAATNWTHSMGMSPRVDQIGLKCAVSKIPP